MKKGISIALVLAMAAMSLAGCGKKNSTTKAAGEGGDASKGSVYFLNFKPESDAQWKELAAEFTKETGIEVKIDTAASGTYEQTLKSAITKKDAPTLFQINGPIGYQSWKDYCADLSDTDLYKSLIDKNMAITSGDGVYGIPYVVEGYGIIYNNAIMEKYFALADKAVDISSAEEITNFDTLKAVVEDMQSKKDELGIEGVFASTSFATGADWRWQTHLANLPVYYEFQDKDIPDAETLDFTYSDNFRNIFDLYIDNSCTDKAMLATKTVDDSMAEFALGQCAMVQNGNWGWGQISGTEGNVVKAEDVKFLPIYTGVDGEETQGLCIGTENYWCVNNSASADDQAATVKFMNWVYSSDFGKDYVTNTLGFIAPFDTFTDADRPEDPLAQEVVKAMSDSKLTQVSWNFTAFPSQTFKDNFGAALLEYTQGNMTWDEVVETFKSEWESEKAAIAE